MATPTIDEAELQVEAARRNFAEQAATLEQRIVGTVDNVVTTVQETTESAKRLVDTTSEKVEHALDVSHYIRENPWTSLLVAVAAGMALGFGSRKVRAGDMALPFPELWATLQREITTVGEQAIREATAAVKEKVHGLAQTLTQAQAAGAAFGGPYPPPTYPRV